MLEVDVGLHVRDTLSPDEVAAWIRTRSLSEADTKKPISLGLKSHLQTEIDRCFGAALVQKQNELNALDPDTFPNFASFKAVRLAIFRQYGTYAFIIQVTNLP